MRWLHQIEAYWRAEYPDRDFARARIRLTVKGERVGQDAFADYNDAAAQLMSSLTEEQLEQIDSALELLLECFEPPEQPSYRSPFTTPSGMRA